MSRHNEMSDPGPNALLLAELVMELEGLGVAVPDSQKFVDRAFGLPAMAEPKAPDLLTGTDEEYVHYAREMAIYRLINSSDKYSVQYDLLQDLARAFAAHMRDHADDLVAQMRPAFDAGLAKARELRQLGVTDEDTAEVLLGRGQEAIEAWNNFKPVAAELDMIGEARINLTRLAGVPPVARMGLPNNRWHLCFNVTQYDRPGEQPWQRWLRLAPSAELLPPSEISDVKAFEQEGLINPGVLEAVAQQRYERRQAAGILEGE